MRGGDSRPVPRTEYSPRMYPPLFIARVEIVENSEIFPSIVAWLRGFWRILDYVIDHFSSIA